MFFQIFDRSFDSIPVTGSELFAAWKLTSDIWNLRATLSCQIFNVVGNGSLELYNLHLMYGKSSTSGGAVNVHGSDSTYPGGSSFSATSVQFTGCQAVLAGGAVAIQANSTGFFTLCEFCYNSAKV